MDHAGVRARARHDVGKPDDRCGARAAGPVVPVGAEADERLLAGHERRELLELPLEPRLRRDGAGVRERIVLVVHHDHDVIVHRGQPLQVVAGIVGRNALGDEEARGLEPRRQLAHQRGQPVAVFRRDLLEVDVDAGEPAPDERVVDIVHEAPASLRVAQEAAQPPGLPPLRVVRDHHDDREFRLARQRCDRRIRRVLEVSPFVPEGEPLRDEV